MNPDSFSALPDGCVALPPCICGADTIRTAIAWYLDTRAVKGATAQTLADLRRYLTDFEKWAERQDARSIVHIDAMLIRRYQIFIYDYRKRDARPLATASKLAKLVPVRTWLRWLSSAQAVPVALAEVIELPAPDRALPERVLSQPEVEKVLAIPDVSLPAGLRDRAILELFYATGIRRMELAQLQVNDVDLDRAVVRVQRGKGRKDRRIPMGPRACAWLSAYLVRARAAFIKEGPHAPLFVNRAGAPLQLASLSTLVARYVRLAGVSDRGSCHLFRHSMATLMLDGGADIRYIQAMLGHAQLSTTQIYTDVSTSRLKQVHLATHPGANASAHLPAFEQL